MNNLIHLNINGKKTKKIINKIDVNSFILFLEKKVTNRKILSKIKREFINKSKISNDISTDFNAAKLSCDEFCIVINEKSLYKGYISDISLIPFGFLLNSEIQVRFLELFINNKNRIYFNLLVSYLE